VDGILAIWEFPLINLMLQKEVSTRFDAELDMRMSQKNDLNAYKVVNEYETNLKQVFLTMES
jgi:16S rRNA (cytosine1402-N4)-methyltransferase